MFTGFDLKITDLDFSSFYLKGEERYKDNKRIIKETLKTFIDKNGILDGTKMQDYWFPQIDADIFISHSHKDEKKAIGLAGWLYENFGLKVFIDSCVWGYSADLLNLIDDDYCLNSKGENGKNYSYERRNYSTSHVHMMLSTALTMMIDRTECLFFLNTPSSLSTKEIIEKTESPWIYHELAMTKLIRKKKLEEYRKGFFKKSFVITEATEKDLVIKYDVSLDHLNNLTQADLSNWFLLNGTINHNYPLDILYANKEVMVDKVLNG